MKLGDDETTIEALKIGYEVMRDKYNEMIKRIEELEHKNKVLVDGVRALFDEYFSYDFYSHSGDGVNFADYQSIDFRLDNEFCDDTLDDMGTKPNEAYTKIKEMLELVEVEE